MRSLFSKCKEGKCRWVRDQVPHWCCHRERERKITLQIATEPSVQESPERNTAFHSLCLGDFFFFSSSDWRLCCLLFWKTSGTWQVICYGWCRCPLFCSQWLQRSALDNLLEWWLALRFSDSLILKGSTGCRAPLKIKYFWWTLMHFVK